MLTAGSPAPKHSDPHAPMDTASTSPGFHVQKNVPEHHQELTLPGQSKSEADELPQNQVSGEEKNAEEDAAETELREAGNRAASGVVDRARDTAERAAGQAQGVAEEASEAVSSASEKASATASGAAGYAKDTAETASETAKSAAGRVADVASNTTEGGRSSTGEGDEGRLSPLQKTSKNPQKSNPGDTAMEDAGSFNTTSGKQQGSSNDDSRHAVMPSHTPSRQATQARQRLTANGCTDRFPTNRRATPSSRSQRACTTPLTSTVP